MRLTKPVARRRRLDGSGITKLASVIWSNFVPGATSKTTDMAVPLNAVPAALQVADAVRGISASVPPAPKRPDWIKIVPGPEDS
jgi:hypothetical protein